MTKFLKRFILFFSALIFISAGIKEKKVRIFIAGDSTAQTYDTTKTVQRGWAQCLQQYFTKKVEVVNLAKAGRSSKSFIDEGRWANLLKQVKKGDYVFIQFGHNDTSKKPERHTDTYQYQQNLIRFCDDVKEKKGKPVIITSIVMRQFDKNGKVVAKRPHFAEYIELAKIAARAADVPCIDLYSKTRDYIQTLGDVDSKKLYFWVKKGESPNPEEVRQDDTHLREPGAVKYAGFVVDDIRELKLKPLIKYIKK